MRNVMTRRSLQLATVLLGISIATVVFFLADAPLPVAGQEGKDKEPKDKKESKDKKEKEKKK